MAATILIIIGLLCWFAGFFLSGIYGMIVATPLGLAGTIFLTGGAICMKLDQLWSLINKRTKDPEEES